MKKILTVLICTMISLGTAGCSSREPLDNEGVKTNLKTAGYDFICVISKGDEACTFGNETDNFMYMEPDGAVFYSERTVYSLEKSKILDGTADEKKLKDNYTKILKEADVTEKEMISTLKSEFETYKTTAEKERKDLENKEFTAGERTTIMQNGIEVAAITFNGASTTDKRNQFDNSGAQQVVMLNYTIENIDVEEDLYLSSVSMTVIGDDGSTASTYPVSGEYIQKCPKGANSTGDEAYGFKTPTGNVKVRVQMYINSEKVTRTFVLNVQ